MKAGKNGLGDDKGMVEKNMIAFTKKNEKNNTKQNLTELFYQFLPLVGFYDEHDGNELKITQHK